MLLSFFFFLSPCAHILQDKDGNVIDFAIKKAAAVVTPAAGAATPTSSASATSSKAATPEPAQDHGALLRQAALDRIEAEDTTKKAAAEKKAKEEAAEKAKKDAEEKAKKEAEEKAKKEAEEKTKKEAEEKTKKEKEATAPKASFSDLLKQPAPAPVAKAAPASSSSSGRIVFSKEDLLRYVSFLGSLMCSTPCLAVGLLFFVRLSC
jgi:outer membrane biosynthesis protein TonB